MKDSLYKGFKKVSEDDRSVTMAHPNGHRLQIAKSGLSSKLRRQLSSLPLNQAEGSEEPIVAPEESAPQETPVLQRDAVADIQNGVQAIGNRFGGLMRPIPKYDGAGNAMPSDGPAPAAEPEPAPEQEAPAPQAAAQAPAADSYGTGAYENALMKGIGEQKAGESQAANVAGQLGEQNAQSYADQAAKQQNLLNEFNENHQNLEKERVAFQNDYAQGHIDPNHLVDSMGTTKKITTAIGLLLGGAGAGIAHESHNPVLDQLNMQIDRDIKAQEMNLGKKQNLLNANLRQFGNMRDATAMTRVMMNDVVSNQLKAQASKMAGPEAKAAALKAAGVLDMQTAPLLQQIAARKALFKQMSSGAAEGVNNQAPNVSQQLLHMKTAGIIDEKEYQSATKELEGAQKTVASHQAADEAFDQIEKEQTPGNRIWNPLQSTKQIGAARTGVVQAVQQSSDSKRFTPEFISSQVTPLVPALVDGKISKKVERGALHHLIDSHAERSGSSPNSTPTLTGLGIPVPTYKGPIQQQQELGYAQMNAGSRDPKVQARVKFIRAKYGR